ncbi:MAG: hypothetical protein ABJA57_09595 [Ginsengibacter sp.]
MTDSFLYNTPAVVISLLLFGFIILFHIAGYQVAVYQNQNNQGVNTNSIGPLEGALLGLFSLLMAFTFNKSASNYDLRKELLLQEANDIGTASLRADLYPDSIARYFRYEFKNYVLARIDYYKAGNNEIEIEAALKNAEIISSRMWDYATMLSQQSYFENSSRQMIPAMNIMMDSMNQREASRTSRVPESILWLLLLLANAGSFIVGYAGNSKKINWTVISIYSIMTVMTIYLILDLDRPRSGIINTSSTHQYMDKLLQSLEVHKNENK